MCEREGERERDTRAHTHTSFIVFVGEFAQVIVLYARTYAHVIYCGIRCASDLNYTHTRNFGTSTPTKEHARTHKQTHTNTHTHTHTHKPRKKSRRCHRRRYVAR